MPKNNNRDYAKFFTLTDSEFSDHVVNRLCTFSSKMSIRKVYITTAIIAIVIATSTTIIFPYVAVFAEILA